MLRQIFIFFLIFTFTGHAVFASPHLSLSETYLLAVKSLESTKISQTQLLQAEEVHSQAKAAFFPKLSASTAYLKQDIPTSTSSTSTSSSFRQSSQTTSKINLSQPLYQGGAEYAGYRKTKLSVKSAKINNENTRLSIYAQVAEAYLAVLSEKQDIKNLDQLTQNLYKRSKEIKSRTRIGQARNSDLLSAQSQVRLAEADMAKEETRLSNLRKNLNALIPGSQAIEPYDTSPTRIAIAPLNFWVSHINNRPDIQATRLTIESSEQEIKLQKAGHMPTLGLESNYYLERDGVLADSEWDVAITLKLPIFAGGDVSSKTRQATLETSIQNLKLNKLYREALVEVETYYQTVLGSIQQINQLRESANLSEKSYKLYLKEYRTGLIGYLEVIQAEKNYWEIKRRLDRMLFESKLDWIKLNLAIGKIP